MLVSEQSQRVRCGSADRQGETSSVVGGWQIRAGCEAEKLQCTGVCKFTITTCDEKDSITANHVFSHPRTNIERCLRLVEVDFNQIRFEITSSFTACEKWREKTDKNISGNAYAIVISKLNLGRPTRYTSPRDLVNPWVAVVLYDA